MKNRIAQLKVFDEILHKQLQPWQSRFSRWNSAEEIIRFAQQTRIKCLKPNEEVTIDHTLSDYSWLGYQAASDYEFIEQHNKRSKINEIFIVPVETYFNELDIVIPEVSSIKVRCFFRLIADEYTRIRSRADHVIDLNFSDDEIRRYAISILQRSRNLLDETKYKIPDLKKKGDRDSFRIFVFLGDILIRTIVFLQKHFKEYLRDCKSSDERELCESLYDCATGGKTKEILSREIYSDNFTKKSYPNFTDASEPSPSECPSGKEKTFFDASKDLGDHSKINPYNKIKLQWNGQVNQLVDVFEQLRITETPEKSMVLEVFEDDLRDFLLQNFVNKQGKPLSFYTLNTLVKSYRTDKKLKENSPKKIDISGKFS